MKLLVEQVEEAKFLIEEKDNKKNYYIEGVFLQSEIKNRNGRIYPKHIMSNEVNRYIREEIEKNRAVGELHHSDTPNIDYNRVSHKILSLREDGNNYIGKAKVVDTPVGRIVKTLIDEGVQFGVSSRATGSLKTIREGNMVQDDLRISTPADIVHDPSAPSAFVQGIMEGKEWVYDILHEKWELVENYKKEIRKTNIKQLEETELKIFENLLRQL